MKLLKPVGTYVRGLMSLKQIGTICFAFLFSIFSTNLFATDPNIPAGATSASCDNSTLNTYSGTSNLQANWEANKIDVFWYSDDEQITTVQAAATTCNYDGTLSVPSTPPTKTGYTFNGWKVRGLPEGYTRLQYIQSSGTQYINTGHTHAANETYEIDVMIDSVDSTYRSIIGASASGSSNTFYISRTTTGLWLCNSTKPINTVPLRTKINLKFVQSNNTVEMFLNDVSQYTASVTSYGLPLMLLARNATQGKAIGKLYGARIYNASNILVQNLIPVKNSSNIIGMYDMVNGTFFTNAGSGTFTAGPVVQ